MTVHTLLLPAPADSVDDGDGSEQLQRKAASAQVDKDTSGGES
jgi:hypothetical protein